MEGVIGIKGYRILCVIGTEEQEREREQEIFVDLKVTVDFSKSTQSDKLNETVDYVTLGNICEEMACKNKYRLLERYASQVLQKILKDFPVTKGWIRVRKPQAIKVADYTYVELCLP